MREGRTTVFIRRCFNKRNVADSVPYIFSFLDESDQNFTEAYKKAKFYIFFQYMFQFNVTRIIDTINIMYVLSMSIRNLHMIF